MSNIVELMKNLKAEDSALFSLLSESGWLVVLEEFKFVWRNYESDGHRGPFETDEAVIAAAHEIQQELKGQTVEEVSTDDEQLTAESPTPSDADESPFDAAITIGERHRRTSDEATLKERLLKFFEQNDAGAAHDLPCASGTADIVTNYAVYEVHCSLNLSRLPSLSQKVAGYQRDLIAAEQIPLTADAIIVTCCAENLEELKAAADDVAVMAFEEVASHHRALESDILAQAENLTQNVLGESVKAEIYGAPAPPTHTLINVDLLRTDGGTQTRTQLNLLKMAEYAELMREGVPFPPCDVFFDGADYWVADGFHRVGATKQAELEEINVLVHQGTRRDAVLFSVGANAAHGIPRTNDDKRRAVEILFEDEEWRQWSDSRIAKAAGVSQPFVSSIRRDLISQNVLPEQAVRKTAGGRVMDTTGISARDDEQETSQQVLPGAEEALATTETGAPVEEQPAQTEAEASPIADSAASNEEPNQATEGGAQTVEPAQEKVAVKATAQAKTEQTQFSRSYESWKLWNQATLSASIKIMPDDGDASGRRVLVIVHEEGGQPLTEFVRDSNQVAPGQTALVKLLDKLRSELPQRMAGKATAAPPPKTEPPAKPQPTTATKKPATDKKKAAARKAVAKAKKPEPARKPSSKQKTEAQPLPDSAGKSAVSAQAFPWVKV